MIQIVEKRNSFRCTQSSEVPAIHNRPELDGEAGVDFHSEPQFEFDLQQFYNEHRSKEEQTIKNPLETCESDSLNLIKLRVPLLEPQPFGTHLDDSDDLGTDGEEEEDFEMPLGSSSREHVETPKVLKTISYRKRQRRFNQDVARDDSGKGSLSFSLFD